MADMNFTLKINEASKFNSGEFEGWGTSLCWWANRVGYNKNLINQAVDKFYSPNGLNLNIGRYNIGGGDCVKDTFDTPYYIDGNNKKQVYDLTTSGLKPEYFGSSMEVYSTSDLSNSTYTRTDNDLNISSGSTVGDIKAISYISKIDDQVDLGGPVTFKNINVTETGRYSLKLLLTLTGTNDRDLAVIVNGVSRYTKGKDIINNNVIASGNNRKLYLITINSITLIQGKNTIEIGGNTTWGLDVVKMAIVRSHNDNEYTPWIDTPMNKKADIYDFLDDRYPTYGGSNQNTYDLEMNTTYTANDANFGIQAGINVGKLKCVNCIPMLDEYNSLGSNVTYKIYVKESGSYSIQLMLYLPGTNDRDVAIKVNGARYSMDASSINNNRIAQNSAGSLYIARFYEIPLYEGVNTIIIGGNTGWTLDLVKLLIVKTSSYGVLPADNEFLHEAHITRSDSKIPGYCVDVTKIDTNSHSIDWYNQFYARVDEECGYAWNYDWEADKYQMNILKAIAKAKGSEFIAEAFSNSPPYFMTNSGCSSGATNSSQNNLRDNAYNAFAKYLADVIAHINNEDNRIKFTSATGMNEPYTNYWGANSNKQEGCHFDQGYSQSRVIKALNWNLKDKGVNNCIISGTDETSIDTAISSYNALDNDAKATISRIDTHTYSGSDRAGLRQLAESEGKNLWMSEVDGDFTHGTNAGEMAAPLGLAHRIIEDLMWMKPSAWILWDIIDMHCDTGNSHDGNDFSWLNTSGGYWGLAACNHDDEYIWCLKKYYAFGQFTRYIRPGYTIFPIDWNSLGAYDRKNNKVVIVAMNTEASDKSAWFSFEQFGTMNTTNITAIRTSGALDGGENWADVSNSCNIWLEKDSKWFTADLKANSITTFIVDNVKLESPSDLSTQVIMYKHKQQLTPVSGTPTTGQYSVTITSTENCTARLESDHKTITLLSTISNDGKINIAINVENVKTYNKSISVASIISNGIVHESIIKQSQLEQNLDGFKATVSATYQTKEDMSNYTTTKAMNSAIDQKAGSITQSVSSTYATKTDLNTANGNISSLTNRMQSAESKLTKDSLTTTIGDYYTTSSDVDGQITSKGYATKSELQQTSTDLTATFNNGYYQGVTQMNAEGVKVYHNQIDGENYTHMSPSGFWIKYKGQDIFVCDQNGLTYKGTITGSTITGGTIKGTEVIGGSLNVEGTLTAGKIVCEDIDSPKYPGVITEDLWLYVSTDGNDDSELESGATFASFDGLLDKLPKNLNGYEVRIEMSTNITENVEFRGYHGGRIRVLMKGHTLYGYVRSVMGSAKITIHSGYIGDNNATNNGWGKIHPSKGCAVGDYTATVASHDSGSIALYNIDVYGADNYLSGSTTKLGVAAADWGAVYMNGVSFYGCNVGARANAGGRIHDALSYNVCTKYGFYATTGGYITLVGAEHSGGKMKNYHEADAGKVIVANGATFAGGEASVPGGSAPVITTKTVTVKSTSGDTYRSTVYNSWKKDNTVRQGDYGYGDCNGIWLFGDQFERFKGKNITKVVITISRQEGGQPASVDLNIKTHNYKSRPSGKPSYVGTVGTLGLAVNTSGSKTITDKNNAIIAGLKAGTIKGIGLQTTYDSAHYAVCSGSVTIKVTYTE